jgi:hypothetical protein
MNNVYPFHTGTDEGVASLYLSNRGLVTTDYKHAELHRGTFYTYSNFATSVPAQGTKCIVVMTNGERIYGEFLINSEAKVQLSLFETNEPSSGNGLAVVRGFNRSLVKENPLLAQLYYIDVIEGNVASGVGTKMLANEFNYAGDTSLMANRGNPWWVLTPGKTYFLEMKNLEVTSKDISFEFNWISPNPILA